MVIPVSIFHHVAGKYSFEIENFYDNVTVIEEEEECKSEKTKDKPDIKTKDKQTSGSGDAKGAPEGTPSPSKSLSSIKGPKLVVTKLLTSYNPSHGVKSGTFVTDIYATIKNIGDAKGAKFFSPTAAISNSIKSSPVRVDHFVLSYPLSKQITLDSGQEKTIIWKNVKFYAPDYDYPMLFFIVVDDVDMVFSLLPSENVKYQELPDPDENPSKKSSDKSDTKTKEKHKSTKIDGKSDKKKVFIPAKKTDTKTKSK